ncbi:MAG TPA: TrbG/VirB9 family P-type conjugative transfer protein [Roseiarcus sp.]
MVRFRPWAPSQIPPRAVYHTTNQSLRRFLGLRARCREALNFRYSIEGDNAAWRPLRAFDDGRQVFIEFPRGISRGEMPPLWVIGAEGGAELVNYRVQGNHMIVDRLFAAAELRLGGEHQKKVRIVRTDGRPQS